MLNKIGALFLVVFLISASACSSTTGGNQILAMEPTDNWAKSFESDHSMIMRVGSTKKTDITKELGAPQSDSATSCNGVKCEVVSYMAVVIDPLLRKSIRTVVFVFPLGNDTLAGYQFADGIGKSQKQVGGQSDDQIAEVLEKIKKTSNPTNKE